MTKDRIWKLTKLFLKLAFTGVSLYLVFSKVSLGDLKEAFIDSDPVYFFVAFCIFAVSQLLASTRLNNFFQGIGLYLTNFYNFKLYLLGMFYNLFLPGGIGGDGYKIYFLRRKSGIKGRKILTAVFFDRLSGVWALAFIICLLIIFIPKIEIPHWLPLTVFLTGTIFYFFIIKYFFNEHSHNFFKTHLKAIAVQSLQLIAVIFVLYALKFNGKFSPYLLMFLASSLVAVFPFTVGGLGAREVVFLYGAEYFQLDSHLAVLISLLFYFISALLSASGTYFIFRPKSLNELKLPDPEKDNIEEIEDIIKSDN
jgi:uncharacterized membrane protein YbhN (UPF0104 family)